MSDKLEGLLGPVEAVPIDEPVDAENNHKNHTEESTLALARSMEETGLIYPIIITKDGSEIVAGHGRLLAAKKLGWMKIKAIRVNADRETAIRMRIAENMMSNQNIDHEKLGAELKELKQLGGEVDTSLLIQDSKLGDLMDALLDEDLDINTDALADDIGAAVDDFTRENDDILEQAQNARIPLRKAFGISDVSTNSARVIGDFMAIVSEETGQKDPELALAVWIEENFA